MSTSKPDGLFKEAVLLHPFFKGMERSTALSLFTECKRLEVGKHTTILKSFEHRLGLYLVINGEVEVVVPKEKEEVLEMISKDGIVGLSSLYSVLNTPVEESVYSSVEVKAKEDCQLCLVPYTSLQNYWNEPYLKNFLLEETSKRLQDVYYSLSQQVGVAHGLEERATILKRVSDIMTKSVITVSSEDSLSDAAKEMGLNRVSSVIVLEKNRIAGIMTERDLVSRCLARSVPLSQPVNGTMTPDPIVITQYAYLYEALATMIDHSIKHLPVVGGKERDGPIVGIITLHDVMKANHIGALTSARKLENKDFPLEKVKPMAESMLSSLWNAHAPVFHVLDFMSGLFDRIYQRILRQVEEALLEEGWESPCQYAFYVMGSAGRKEQFMLTDQDHFLVYEKHSEGAVDYFCDFAERVVVELEKAGLRLCDGGMMANQKTWTGSVASWEERLREWSVHSSEETLLKVQNFFSYRFLYGDETLHSTFEDAIKDQLRSSKILLVRLAQVEKSKPVPALHSSIRSILGMDRKTVSIKKNILFPFHHALQILNAAHGNTSGSTREKIDFLTKKRSISEDFAEELSEAFQELMKLYIELKRKDQGDTVHLSTLSTRKKENLYKSVKTIREFQHMMLSHYSLT
jgi:CBS domain-containing protein